jgi:hypothetical protein
MWAKLTFFPLSNQRRRRRRRRIDMVDVEHYGVDRHMHMFYPSRCVGHSAIIHIYSG